MRCNNEFNTFLKDQMLNRKKQNDFFITLAPKTEKYWQFIYYIGNVSDKFSK